MNLKRFLIKHDLFAPLSESIDEEYLREAKEKLRQLIEENRPDSSQIKATSSLIVCSLEDEQQRSNLLKEDLERWRGIGE